MSAIRDIPVAEGQETIVGMRPDTIIEQLRTMATAGKARNDPTLAIALSPDVILALLDEADRLRWIVKLTDLYLRHYGLANTSGERHDDRKERVRDIRAEIAALPTPPNPDPIP